MRAALGTPPGVLVKSSRSRQVAALAAAAVSTGAVAALVLVRDPHIPGLLPTCPTYALLGVYCPGCGSLRGIHDVLTGNWVEAAGHNLLLIPALAWLAWFFLARVVRLLPGGRLADPPSSSRFALALLISIVMFTLARNVPGSPLAP